MTVNTIFLLLLMIFLHIVDDYYLQGRLSELKQKKVWRDNPEYKDFYKYDYIVALICHGFSWSFVIHLPFSIMYFTNLFDLSWDIKTQGQILFMIIIQAIVHSLIDDMKANDRSINLIQDQSIHLIQIIISLAVLIK